MVKSQLRTDEGAGASADFDAVVVGAGIAGLYMLHRLRGLGLKARAFEAGDGVGGTWFWNRYPGARCDVPSIEYSYSFSRELEQEWEWTEVMPAQEEVERYLNHVADRFDLRRDIELETRVTSATFDEHANLWTVETDKGGRYRATYCIMATGCLSMPLKPDVPGMDSFAGLSLQTSLWPKEGVDLGGLRVGMIGTGSSGVQATPIIAEQASHLYIFQRTATYTFPAGNRPLNPEFQRRVKDNYPEIRQKQRESIAGISGWGLPQGFQAPTRKILETSEEDRMALLEELGWGAVRAFADVQASLEANEAAVDLYREMIRAHRQGCGSGGGAVAARLPPRLQASGVRYQLLRRLQPRQRDPGRPQAGRHRGGDANGYPHVEA